MDSKVVSKLAESCLTGRVGKASDNLRTIESTMTSRNRLQNRAIVERRLMKEVTKAVRRGIVKTKLL